MGRNVLFVCFDGGAGIILFKRKLDYVGRQFLWDVPSGYSDPTAYKAITSADADDERFHKLLNTIFTICELSGFHLEELNV